MPGHPAHDRLAQAESVPRDRVRVEAVAEWGLRSEPWFFAIDNKGNVAAKYEGPVSLAELEEAVQLINK